MAFGLYLANDGLDPGAGAEFALDPVRIRCCSRAAHACAIGFGCGTRYWVLLGAVLLGLGFLRFRKRKGAPEGRLILNSSADREQRYS